MLTNPSLLFTSSFCYMITLLAQSLVNHPHSATQPQPTRLPSHETSKNTLLIHTIRTFTNGSILISYTQLLIRIMTPPSPPSFLYDTNHLQSTVVRATLIYQQDLILFLSFTEWRTTLGQYPTRTPTHPINTPLVAWHTYRLDLTHPSGTCMPPPRHYISTFR